jgi:hypothetical protein
MRQTAPFAATLLALANAITPIMAAITAEKLARDQSADLMAHHGCAHGDQPLRPAHELSCKQEGRRPARKRSNHERSRLKAQDWRN